MTKNLLSEKLSNYTFMGLDESNNFSITQVSFKMSQQSYSDGYFVLGLLTLIQPSERGGDAKSPPQGYFAA